MVKNKDKYETISIDIKPELIRLINSKTNNIDLEESDILQSCIQTGLRLGEMDMIFHKKKIEESAFQKQLNEAYGDRTRSSLQVLMDLERIRGAECVDESPAHDQSSSKISYKTLKVRLNHDLYEEIRSASEKLGVEIVTFVRYCIRTGLYLKDLNLYLQDKDK